MKSLTHLTFFCVISLTASMAFGQNVGIGTLSPDSTLSVNNKLVIGGAQGDLVFTDDEGSILFPSTTAPNSPMIHMFKSGTTNADRMVIAHSPGASSWGLQYNDVGDKFQFLKNGANVLTVDLNNTRLGIGTATPATRFHLLSTSSSTMRLEGPNNFFDFYSTNGTQANGMRFYDDGIFAGGMFYEPDNDYVFFGSSAAESNSTVFMDLSGSRKLALVANALPTDHSVAIGGNVHILSGAEAGLLTHGYLQMGSTTGSNLVMDNNEITARNNSLVSPLFLQPNQGNVIIGSTSNWPATLHVAGQTGEAALRVQVAGSTEFIVDSDGAVMVNTASNKKPGYELNVDGQIVAEEVLVQNSVNWPDYVFAADYTLPRLTEVENFIAQNRHLPDVPSATQMESDGINLGEMDKTLLRKIEELTLYVIQQSKDIEQLKHDNAELKAAMQR